jgi:ketosteroid isomerase-like protein
VSRWSKATLSGAIRHPESLSVGTRKSIAALWDFELIAKEVTTVADIDDLKATFEQVVAAICRRDASAYSNFWHEQIVAFPPFSPFAVEGKAILRSMAEANFAQNESVTFSPINPQCRVIGNTGIVWGHTALTRKPKDGPLTTLFARFTFIFAKTDGQWREVAVHVSQLPTAG